MTDIIAFQTEDAVFYRDFVRALPERRTQDIIADLKYVPMIGEEFAIVQNVLFAELAVKGESV